MTLLAMMATLCGCGRDSSVPSGAGEQGGPTNGAAGDETVPAGQPPVELKQVRSSSPTQHQFRITARLSDEERPSKPQ